MDFNGSLPDKNQVFKFEPDFIFILSIRIFMLMIQMELVSKLKTFIQINLPNFSIMKTLIIFAAIQFGIITLSHAQVNPKKEVKEEKRDIKKREHKEKREKLAQDRQNMKYEKERKMEDQMNHDKHAKTDQKTIQHERKRKKQDKKSKVVNP
jgi:hypothetical protein